MFSRKILALLAIALFVFATNAAPSYEKEVKDEVDDFDFDEVVERVPGVGQAIFQISKNLGTKLGKEVSKEVGKEAAKQIINHFNNKNKDKKKLN